MAAIPFTSEHLFERTVRQGEVKHALKTALACALAALLSFAFHLPSGQLAPLFVFLLFAAGMLSPRMNWLLSLVAISISIVVSALILIVFRDANMLYLVVTLAWVFFCILLSGWYPLPATLAAMVTAISLFTFFDGTVGETLDFFVGYWVNLLVGGIALVVVHTFVWPLNTPKIFAERLAQAYSYLESQCRTASQWLRTGAAPPPIEPFEDWAPFRNLRQVLAPELFRGRDTQNPFARLILACRGLNLRLWFFNRAFGHLPSDSLSPALRAGLADLLDRAAAQLAALVRGALDRTPVPSIDPGWLSALPAATDAAAPPSADPLLANQVHTAILQRLLGDLQAATLLHNRLFAHFGHRGHGELVALCPSPAAVRLLDPQSIRAAVKLVLILLLLLVEEGWLGLPGSSQVAFFATFFATTANLGRQNKIDLIDVIGLLCGFAYGVVAAYLTSRVPSFALLLLLVFSGQFLASLAYRRLPLYSFAGLQAGLAIPFALLAATGPEWGDFATVRTRLVGLLMAGITAVIVHACVWPVLPMRQLRASIAAALRATATSLVQLFTPPCAHWQGSPPALREAILRARDLLDDARYLPGDDRAEESYRCVIRALQELDANLEYLHLLIGCEADHPLRQQFFATLADYPHTAEQQLRAVAGQFDNPPTAPAASVWQPNATARWQATPAVAAPPGADLRRPLVLAHCLDQIAATTVEISRQAQSLPA